MKTLKLSATICLALLTTIFFAGCKKNKDATKKPDCRIITAAPVPSGDPYNISYNQDGKVSTVNIGTATSTYVYSGNTVIGNTTSSGAFSEKTIITLNSNGLAINVKTEFNEAGTEWNNQVYEYSGTELIKSTSTTSGGAAPLISTYTWKNGNLASATSGTSITTVEYYTDKPAQQGDYLSLSQLVGGFQVYKNKNLIKSLLSNGSAIINFSYTFDGDGKINDVDITGGSTGKLTYQYQCN